METNFLDALKVLIAQHAFHGESMPAIGAVSTKDVPSPWAAVVVNSGSMTANLEKCYGDRILLTLLGDDIHVPDKTLGRAVILRTERGAVPVALAGLRIHLERFPPEVRVRFVEAVSPFGGILRQEGIGVLVPGGFLRQVPRERALGTCSSHPAGERPLRPVQPHSRGRGNAVRRGHGAPPEAALHAGARLAPASPAPSRRDGDDHGDDERGTHAAMKRPRCTPGSYPFA
jgi:hypothetical protein